MSDPCPVNTTILKLKDLLEPGRLQDPQSRRLSEEALQLLNDIAWGRAGEEHLGFLQSLAQTLMADGRDTAGQEAGAIYSSRPS